MKGTLEIAVLVAVLGLTVVAFSGCVGGSGSTTPDADPVDTEDPAVTDDEGASDAVQAHVHDRWEDESGNPTDEVVLVDRTIDVHAVHQDEPRLVNQCRKMPRNGPAICAGQATFHPETYDDGTGKIVPPGTEKVDVTFEFASDAFSKLRVYYQHRMSQGRYKELGTFTSGDTKTISPVPVEISDDGHAKVSAWTFHIEAKGNPYMAEDPVWYGDGQVDAKIVAHRTDGPLPLEPPHPPFWEDTSVYRVSHLDASVDGFTQVGRTHVETDACPTSVAGQCTPFATNSRGLLWMLSPGYEGTRIHDIASKSELDGSHDRALVPPASKMLGARVEVDGETTQPVEVCLRTMKSPEEGPYGIPLDCERYDGGTAEFTFDKVLSDRELDSFYTDNTGRNASRWTFFVQVAAPDQAGNTRTVGSFQGSVTAAVYVADRADLDLPTWGMDGGSDA